MVDEDFFYTLANQFADETTLAVVLMGSYARVEAQQYSDIDLVRIVAGSKAPEPKTHFIAENLVVVSSVSVEQTELWFTEPKQVVEVVKNLQQAKTLLDPLGFFENLQQRALQFTWTSELQDKANDYAVDQMVGLIEEVHKGFNGLAQHHIGRLINANHGLVWGLTYIVLVQTGTLINGDNDIIAGAQRAMGTDSDWSQLQRQALGIPVPPQSAPSLEERTRAGLDLYQLTYQTLDMRPDTRHHNLITNTIERIRRFGDI